MKTETKILYVVSLATFMRSFSQVIISPSLVTMRNDLGTTTAMIGWTLTIYGLILAISQIAYGPIVDRFDTKQVLIFGLALFTLASLFGYPAGNIWLLIIVRAFQAVGIAAAASVGIAMIADVFPPGKRGHAMSIFETFNSVGAAAGPLAGAALAVWFHWRLDFLLLALVAALILLAAIRGIPALPSSAQIVGIEDMLNIISTPATFGALALGFAHFYGLYTMHTMLPVLLTEQFGAMEGKIGIVLAFLPVGVIAGALVGGRYADRVGARLPVLVGTAGAVFSFSVLAFISGQPDAGMPLYYVSVLVLVSGAMMGLCLPVLIKLMVEYFPLIRGTAGALQYFARFIGSALAPTLTGYLNDSRGLPYGIGSAAVLIALGWLLSIFVVRDAAPQLEMA